MDDPFDKYEFYEKIKLEEVWSNFYINTDDATNFELMRRCRVLFYINDIVD
jgi:hypothetical protein